MAKEIAEEYASSLADLTVNSKPLINMLTILAEENIEHAGVIVDTVENHLEKVQPEIKLPLLYLVDSIIKNVGGAYTQKFSQSIVNMFTKTFKQVDEKTRSQMFKLRETWHDVFPATKLYQLDVKVNLIDPAWPIQSQTHQSNIHVNPNFLKKPVATTSATAPKVEEDEQMRAILAKKEQELLMLQQKKIEMKLEQTRRQLELAQKKMAVPPVSVMQPLPVMPVATVSPVIPSPQFAPEVAPLSAKQRLGPPVNVPKPMPGVARIAPVSGAMLAASRRDPRLARHQNQMPNIAPNVFDIKPLNRVTKRKNVITIDVKPDDRRRRDPRLDKRNVDDKRRKDKVIKKPEEKSIKEIKRKEDYEANLENSSKSPNEFVDDYINKLHIADPKKINKLPPIPKIVRPQDVTSKDNFKNNASPKKNITVNESPIKKKNEKIRFDKKNKKREAKDSPDTSPDKKNKKEARKKPKEQEEAAKEVPEEAAEEKVAFKELKNYNKRHNNYRRNKEQSQSPEVPAEDPTDAQIDSSNIPGVVVENKDVDLRLLHSVVAEAKAAPIVQKRPSTEASEVKHKKAKLDKFDILFGNEDVDLRQLPQVEEAIAPPPPCISEPAEEKSQSNSRLGSPESVISPHSSPKQKDWHDVKEQSEDVRKGPSKLDLVRAKLAEATKGKDGLGRPFKFNKSPSVEKERRRTISAEEVELRSEPEDEVNKETISLILSQAKEHFNDGKMDKNQYNTLMFQVMQLNEKLKLKEAKQRESLEISKKKLKKAYLPKDAVTVPNVHRSPNPDHNKFGDIDERINPIFQTTPPHSQDISGVQDFDMRVGVNESIVDVPISNSIMPRPPMPPMPPMFMGPFPPMWRGIGPRGDDFTGPRRPRGPPPFFRGKFDQRPPFDARFPGPIPLPKFGMYQGESPVMPYTRSESPPLMGNSGIIIPPTDLRILDYIDQDPMKTIEIDGVPREIRFYGETAVIMLDWDDPREIRFLPGARRVTFDNKDSVVLNFNEEYKKVEIDDQVFDIRFGAPTRELYINGRWYECFFGAPPSAVVIDGKPRMIQLDGPPPQVDIGKNKRTELVAGKINIIVDAQHMCPVFLDAKIQKFLVDGQYYTIRFVDSLKTVLINEVPFKVEFGGLPKPIFMGHNKHFIRFSVLPRHSKPGQVTILNMEGSRPQLEVANKEVKQNNSDEAMETDQELPRPAKILSPDGENSNHGGLDVLASLMPSSMAPASSFSGYSLAEPLFSKTDASIPGLDAKTEEKPANTTLPILGNINVNDLFAKLVASGIVQGSVEKKEPVTEDKEEKKSKEDKNVIHVVDFLRPETLRVKQPALVSALYSGMQCSGCGARFPPERTTKYSAHLDWHFRENRRRRDAARRAHCRRWHYDLPDWLQYDGAVDLAEREKSWFETAGTENSTELPESEEEPPSVPAGPPIEHACALCGDKFLQYYCHEQEEWRLRNSVRHADTNYHPACLNDYKASLAKAEAPEEDTVEEVETILLDKTEPIEIKDADDTNSQSDNDDVVEVFDETKDEVPEPVEIDEGDEDDVIYKAEPVEEVLVDDDNDTDDETVAERQRRDQQAFDFSQVKVKQEPVDPDDEPVITAEEEPIREKIVDTSITVLSSIDGNFQLESTPQVAPAIPPGGIKINITKNIPSIITNNEDKMLEDISADDEPLPPGEETELEYTVKPALKDVQLSRQPPVQKDQELSGLCSIM